MPLGDLAIWTRVMRRAKGQEPAVELEDDGGG
jgi:hypothetical protein